jgi:hypothetical protein
MKTIRKITESNFKEQILLLKQRLSESYLRKVIDSANAYDEDTQDLIITQQFIK